MRGFAVVSARDVPGAPRPGCSACGRNAKLLRHQHDFLGVFYHLSGLSPRTLGSIMFVVLVESKLRIGVFVDHVFDLRDLQCFPDDHACGPCLCHISVERAPSYLVLVSLHRDGGRQCVPVCHHHVG